MSLDNPVTLKKSHLSLFALIMLITGAVDGVSNMPSIAIFGQQLIFFFITASLIFLLPTGLISAELCAQFTEESGIYTWGKRALGSHFGLLVIWLQWINTMIWFPTCLTTLVGTAAYLVSPTLSHHPLYLVGTSLVVFWSMTLLNFRGIKHSAGIAAFASTIGMVIPMFAIIALSITWVILDKPLALTITHEAILPKLNEMSTWSSLTAVITAFLGMELATVHVKKVNNAHRVFPRALMCAVILIVLTMGLGSLSVALVIPHHQIVLVTGTIQAFQSLFDGFNIPWMEKILGLMLVFGSLGAMVNWLISPAHGLAQACHDGYLSKRLSHENSHGVPQQILIIQALVVSALSTAFFLMPSINGSYWLLIALSTELYVCMYFLMFIAAICLLIKSRRILIIPGGKIAALLLCVLGLVGCVSTLIVGFFPPSTINTGGSMRYILLFSVGLITMVSPAFLLIAHKKAQDKKRSLSLT